jgi:hypothetical protein
MALEECCMFRAWVCCIYMAPARYHDTNDCPKLPPVDSIISFVARLPTHSLSWNCPTAQAPVPFLRTQYRCKLSCPGTALAYQCAVRIVQPVLI